MADIIELHPSVRENREPRMSAAALAEYLILKPDQQERILHDSRFASPIFTTPYRSALEPTRAFCCDVQRDSTTLEAAKSFLNGRAADRSVRPKQQEEARRCVETIDLFQRSLNAFGLNSLNISLASRFDALQVSGVALSVQPDLLDHRQGKAGCVLFRAQKAPDPESCRLEETRRQRGDHRREMAKYMLAMAQMLFEDQGRHLGEFSREHTFVADIRLGERIPFSTSDHAARIRAIKAACKQVASLWTDIEPRKAFLKNG